MPNGRCKMHGGTNSGAPVGNQNAHKHGIYSRNLREDELPLVDEIKSAAGTLHNELLIARLQLRRALIAQAVADEMRDGMEVAETTERQGAENVSARSEVKKRLRDYPGIINSIIARIESLELRRKDLTDGKPPGGDDMTRVDTFLIPDEPVPRAPIL